MRRNTLAWRACRDCENFYLGRRIGALCDYCVYEQEQKYKEEKEEERQYTKELERKWGLPQDALTYP